MELPQKPYLFFLILGLYLGCSIPIFNEVYKTSKVVVDEMFHIPQAQAYCDGRYDVWDPKITTLPGLYIAVKIINLVVECSTYYLRMFNLIISTVNLGIFYVTLNFVYGLCCSRFNIALQSLSLAILPPLYFFSHVFYTDTLSLTFLLLFTLSVINRTNCSIIIFGICSIVTRQTNVVWILMIFSQKTLEMALKSSRVYANDSIKTSRRRSGLAYEVNPKALKRNYNGDDLLAASNFHWENDFKYFFNWYMAHDLKSMFYTLAPILLFAIFVLCNGSIVVGDKDAHTMTIHLPQMLYFLLFYGFFGLPIVLSRLKSTFIYMCQNKDVVAILMLASLFVVGFNTVVHPYLLADNRHYSFYVWNRWFGRYPEAVYTTTPVYVFLACSLLDNIIHQNCISFYLSFFLWLFPALCLQRLLEIRYFIIPYVIARMRFAKLSTRVAVMEFLWYAAINAAYFTVFFTKEVKWSNFTEIQRIIW